jgi:hypothetical protein
MNGLDVVFVFVPQGSNGHKINLVKETGGTTTQGADFGDDSVHDFVKPWNGAHVKHQDVFSTLFWF